MSKDSLTRELVRMSRVDKALLVACVLLAAVCAVMLMASLAVREDNWVLHVLTFFCAGGSGVFNAFTILVRNR